MTFSEAVNLVALRMNLVEEDKVIETEISNEMITNISVASKMLKEKRIMEESKTGILQISDKGQKISIDEFCELFDVEEENVKLKTGEEFFYLKNERLKFQLKNFWSWN